MKSKRKHISHREHQANMLIKLAEGCDKRIIQLQHRKIKLLQRAAKLQAESKPPTEEAKVIGFR